MLQEKTLSTEMPVSVVIETRDDGKRVILSGAVTEIEYDGAMLYQYDEVVFMLPDNREETVKSVQSAFNDWWEYGKQTDETIPSLEQRVKDLEIALMSLIGGDLDV